MKTAVDRCPIAALFGRAEAVWSLSQRHEGLLICKKSQGIAARHQAMTCGSGKYLSTRSPGANRPHEKQSRPPNTVACTSISCPIGKLSNLEIQSKRNATHELPWLIFFFKYSLSLEYLNFLPLVLHEQMAF
jgi:hypothetical protein